MPGPRTLYKEWITVYPAKWIIPYPADKIGIFLVLFGQGANFIHWIGIYPLDKAIDSVQLDPEIFVNVLQLTTIEPQNISMKSTCCL